MALHCRTGGSKVKGGWGVVREGAGGPGRWACEGEKPKQAPRSVKAVSSEQGVLLVPGFLFDLGFYLCPQGVYMDCCVVSPI